MPIFQCPECGQTLAERTASCPYCGFPLTSLPDPNAPEVTISNDSCFYFKDGKMTLLSTNQGTVFLSSRRIAFFKFSAGQKFLLGGMTQFFAEGKVPVLELNLTDIYSIHVEKQQMNKRLLIVTMKDSGRHGFFITSKSGFSQKSEEWMDLITKAIIQYLGRTPRVENGIFYFI